MRINEVADINTAKLAALSQFLLGRARNTMADRTISTDTFIKMATNLGIGLSVDRLMELSQQQPLSNIIRSMNQNVIQFNDPTQKEVTPTPDVDQDQQIVSQMAKRAMKK
jgi:hypothetical protein